MIILLPGDDDQLRSDVQAAAPAASVFTRAELGSSCHLRDVEVAFGWLPGPLDAMPSLRWLQLMGAGIDGVLSDELRASTVVVSNARIHAAPIAEHLFGMALVLTRRLDAALSNQQSAHWVRNEPAATADVLSGRRLGVLGLGVIGTQIARIGAAIGMPIVGLSRRARPHSLADQVFSPDQRLDFFGASDVVMSTLPLTPATRRFVGDAELEAMPRGGIYANAGRGGTTDTDALIRGLTSGHLGGVCLDVTDPEPLPDGHPLWSTPNALITPHYAGAHLRYMEHAAATFIDNLRRYVAGEELENVVDKDEGY